MSRLARRVARKTREARLQERLARIAARRIVLQSRLIPTRDLRATRRPR